jgi:hypothetical protein
MPVKPAFAAELIILLMNLLPSAWGGQFLFPAAVECST